MGPSAQGPTPYLLRKKVLHGQSLCIAVLGLGHVHTAEWYWVYRSERNCAEKTRHMRAVRIRLDQPRSVGKQGRPGPWHRDSTHIYQGQHRPRAWQARQLLCPSYFCSWEKRSGSVLTYGRHARILPIALCFTRSSHFLATSAKSGFIISGLEIQK